MINERQIFLIREALHGILTKTKQKGSVVYLRFLESEVIGEICKNENFQIEGWKVYGVTDINEPNERLITSDKAVEIREDKADSVLFMIDSHKVRTGLDSIYSAGREIKEEELYKLAIEKAKEEIPKGFKIFCKKAVSKAKRISEISIWREFEFYSQCIDKDSISQAMTDLYLWPVYFDDKPNDEDLDKSLILIERLIKDRSINTTVEEKIEKLFIDEELELQKRMLQEYLKSIINKSLSEAVRELKNIPEIWLNKLHFGIFNQQELSKIEIVPWRGKNNKPLNWSGLTLNANGFLQLNLNQNSKLEVRFKTFPDNLKKDCAEFLVSIKAGAIEETLSEKTISHNGKNEQKCQFRIDDFQVDEEGIFEAKIHINVIGNQNIETKSEEFLIRFGESDISKVSSTAKTQRALIEGAIYINEYEEFIEACNEPKNYFLDAKKEFITFKYHEKSVKVNYPPLLKKIEDQWDGSIGKWVIKIRNDGTLAESIKFINFNISDERLIKASLSLFNLSKSYKSFLGLIYTPKNIKDKAEEYLNAWIAVTDTLYEKELALINTVEVKSISNKTIGIIVLPMHPLMIAWHYAYDQLLSYYRYEHEKGLKSSEILSVCKVLDCSYFPSFLPGQNIGETFIFGDNLGFYFTAMISDRDKEPKASIAMIARALYEGKESIVTTIGKTTSDVLADEIHKYISLHNQYRNIHINVLRPGEGRTVGKALGQVIQKIKDASTENNETSSIEDRSESDIAFILDLYSSINQNEITGKFFQSVAEKRRTGTGVSEEDSWIFEVIQREGNISYPRLLWSKRIGEYPYNNSHLSIAFDTFESKVVNFSSTEFPSAPIESYGLKPSLLRDFKFNPFPIWKTYIPYDLEGEKHPASRALTDRIIKIQSKLMRLTSYNINGSEDSLPVLVTEITPENEDSISKLHSLTDWVITVDRNAGIEYFDSPKEKPNIFDAYIIDCVPEREDFGFLQMVTSTANLDEAVNFLDKALYELNISPKPKNCIFILNELKSLSGRFVLKFAGYGYKPYEMITLASIHHCCRENESNEWLSLKDGFFIPLDEVPYLIESKKEKIKSSDLLYVSLKPRGGFKFTFLDVRFNRNLKAVRDVENIRNIVARLNSIIDSFIISYGEKTSPFERAIKYPRLARVLRFYANKGKRHYLSQEAFNQIDRELNKILLQGTNYEISKEDISGRGYVFCSEYESKISSLIYNDEYPIYLFGKAQIENKLEKDIILKIDEDEKIFKADNENKEKSLKGFYEEKINNIGITSSWNSQGITDINNKSIEEGEMNDIKTPEIKEKIKILLGFTRDSQDEIYWDISIRSNPHLLLVGLSGMGKTTCLINISIQMLEQGIKPIIFSYHEDIDEKLTKIYGNNINFIDYNGLGFNPLEIINESKTGYIDNASMLRDIFAAIFPELGDIQLGRLREAIKQSYIDKGWEININDISKLQVPDFKTFYLLLKSIPKPDKSDKGLLIRLDELNDYGFFDVIADNKNIFMSNNPIIIRIHKTQNEVMQKAFSIFLLHHLYKQMFLRGIQENITHSIIFDEAHKASKLKLIPTMVKECRKFGISFILASQEIKDFDRSIYNSIANYLVLRLNETDAKAIAKAIAPSEEISYYTDRIKQINKYHAFFYGEGMRKPSIVKLKDINLS
ncbi:MAG: hypothetical protein N3A00_03245 [Thermodesulfovibrio sp.]|nr:hypothetical protein [Thermodesulfovibrio sp.]